MITPLLSYRIDAAYLAGKFLGDRKKNEHEKVTYSGCGVGPTGRMPGCCEAGRTGKAQRSESSRFADWPLWVLQDGRSAHTWARDAQPFSLESQVNSDSTGKDGKSAVWRAGFASPLSRATKPYSWSGTDAQDAPARGINNGSDSDYTPNNSNTQVFDPAFLKVDTDKVFQTAQKHGGEKILTAAPNTPITYRVSWDRNTGKLIWHVNYGEGKLVVEVDASSGDFIRVQK